MAMGFSHEQITGSLRLSIGVSNTKSEIDKTVDALKEIVAELRAVSPFKAKYGF
jgi:cysteine desulfurase